MYSKIATFARKVSCRKKTYLRLTVKKKRKLLYQSLKVLHNKERVTRKSGVTRLNTLRKISREKLSKTTCRDRQALHPHPAMNSRHHEFSHRGRRRIVQIRPLLSNRDSFRLLNHVYLINTFNIHDERDRCFDFGPSKIIRASRDSRTAVMKLFTRIDLFIRVACVERFKIIFVTIIYQNTSLQFPKEEALIRLLSRYHE